MEYYFSKTIQGDFDTVEKKAVEELKREGFGVITEIDMQAKLKEKLGKDIGKYKIIGACNPPYAYNALLVEDRIGVMLPCNVAIIDRENGYTEVVAINPSVSMLAVENPELKPMASEVTNKLRAFIQRL